MHRQSLWAQITAALPASEREPARKLIGKVVVEEVEDAAREGEALEEILELYREQVDEERAKRSKKPVLPPPPVLEYVEREIQFFLGHLQQAGASVRPQTPSEDKVLRYVTRKSGRPGTAGRPNTVDGAPTDRSCYSPVATQRRPGTATNLSEILPKAVTMGNVGEAGVLERLRKALTEERDALVQYADEVRGWLEQEHDNAHDEAQSAAEEKPPPLADMRSYSNLLQEQYLRPDPLAAIFASTSPTSAKPPSGGASLSPSPQVPSSVPPAALGPVRPPASVVSIAAAGGSRGGLTTMVGAAADLPQQEWGGGTIASGGSGGGVGAAASSSRVARVDRLRQQVSSARLIVE